MKNPTLYEHFVWPESTTQEQKEFMMDYFRRIAKEKERLCVIYRPSCGCEYDSFVVLDRVPMSKKIHHLCELCNKGCFLEISDPIVFHCPWNEKDISLYDLLDMQITEGSDQEYFIKYYHVLAKTQKEIYQ